eukprot:4549848-Ditylum_brightwellii.AAC.1
MVAGFEPAVAESAGLGVVDLEREHFGVPFNADVAVFLEAAAFLLLAALGSGGDSALSEVLRASPGGLT